VLLYYITDRSQFAGDESSRRRALLEKIAEAAECGVDFIQLREKDLSTHELMTLARDAMRILRDISPQSQKRSTSLLINSRTDVAIAAGADGIHLRSDDISPKVVRNILSFSDTRTISKVISAACHSLAEVTSAAENRADFVLFGPIFEKRGLQPGKAAGLEALWNAGQLQIPVVALGGITSTNARECLEAGAAGIAGIRIFQQNKIQDVIDSLRV
jgi:thiamine-phosphate pyrophosphorylase